VVFNEGRIEVTGARARALPTGLQQRCTSKDSWHCNKTAAINSKYCGWFSVGSKTSEPYHYTLRSTHCRVPLLLATSYAWATTGHKPVSSLGLFCSQSRTQLCIYYNADWDWLIRCKTFMTPSKPVTYRKVTGAFLQLLRPNYITEDACPAALKNCCLQTAVVNVQLLEYHASNDIQPAPKLTDTRSEPSHFDHSSFILPVLLPTETDRQLNRKEYTTSSVTVRSQFSSSWLQLQARYSSRTTG